MAFTNSPLVSYTRISPYSSGRDGHKIDTITIHCFVGQVTAKRGCEVFQQKNSCNYVVGYDGSIGLVVEEKDRSWCTSNRANDARAVTIEVACASYHPYEVTSKAYAALLDLVTDICRRNGINKLVWSTNKADRIGHRNGCNMTVHRDYENKACPGQWLYERHGQIAAEVNKRLTEDEEMERWKTINDVPAGYREMAQRYIAAGALKGKGDGEIDLTEDMIRVMEIMRRYFENMMEGK